MKLKNYKKEIRDCFFVGPYGAWNVQEYLTRNFTIPIRLAIFEELQNETKRIRSTD